MDASGPPFPLYARSSTSLLSALSLLTASMARTRRFVIMRPLHYTTRLSRRKVVPTKGIDMYASLPIQVFRMVHVVDSDVVLMEVLIRMKLWKGKVLITFAHRIVFLWRLPAPPPSLSTSSFFSSFVKGSTSQQAASL